MPAEPFVSVIIPAYNAEKTIADALEAVVAQDYAGRLELIVVNDGSTDQTERVVGRYAGVRCISQVNAGPASARNRGAKESCGEILLFTDSDCRPERSWVSRMLQGFSSEGVSVVAGSYGIANPGSLLARIIHEEIIFRHRVLMPDFPRSFGSYNFAVRRAVFNAVGGFNSGYRCASGEDNDLSYKILAQGGRILFLRDALVAHYHQESFSKYLKEQYRHGVWRVKMYLDHPAMVMGDGYTFWKDIVEVPLVAAHGFIFIWTGAGVFLFFGFFIFEIMFGYVVMRSWADAVAAGFVMWARSFVRTAGFLFAGCLYLTRSFPGGKKK